MRILKSNFSKKCNSRCSAWEISNLSLKMKFLQTLSTLDSLQPTGGSRFHKALENSPENFKIQKLGENFKIQKALENSPVRISKFKSWERILQ